MLGAIAGDTIGSIYEFRPIKTRDFPLFGQESIYTDDTVLTVAVAEVLLRGGSYVEAFHRYYRAYPCPYGDYGPSYARWAESGSREPYNSLGNGAAMRVSPVGWAYDTLEETLTEAERSAAVTHNHPEGIRGAQAAAACVFLARTGAGRAAIRDYVEQAFGYDLSEPTESIRTWYAFDVTCSGTVPPAIRAFLDSRDFEEAVRLAVSLGGDADTLACITGGIAEAFYGGVPAPIAAETLARLPASLADVTTEFRQRFVLPRG